MKTICFILLFFHVTSLSLSGQQPLVVESFDHLYIEENFDSSNSNWTTLSNNDNLIIIQEGEIIMHRKATFSPYAVMANFEMELDAYRLVTSIKLEKTDGKDGSIGIVFMAQADGKGGFIFEINKDHRYRLRQITNNSYRYLTGAIKDFGWVKNEIVKGLTQSNVVEVRTSGKKYDLYVNHLLLTSFESLEYKTGGIGFIIGPESKGKADYLYLFGNEKIETSIDSASNVLITNPNANNDITSLAESIIILRTQNNKLQEENKELRNIINEIKKGEDDQQTSLNIYDKELKNMEAQLKKSEVRNDSLVKVNKELMKYKEIVKGNDNGDLVINLSKNLKNEKKISDELRKSNKILNDSIATLRKQIKK